MGIDEGENKEETIQYENNDEDKEDLEIKHEELEMEVVERKLSYEDDVVEVDVIEEEEDEKVLDNIQERNEDHEIEKEDYFAEQNNSSDSEDSLDTKDIPEEDVTELKENMTIEPVLMDPDTD